MLMIEGCFDATCSVTTLLLILTSRAAATLASVGLVHTSNSQFHFKYLRLMIS